MTVKVSKPAINVREELADLKKPTGIAGEAMLSAETPQEQFNLIGAGRTNMVINGDFQLAQRGASAATATTTAAYRSVDRWKVDIDDTSGSGHNWSIEQSTDAPNDFNYSAKVTVITSGSQPSGTGDRHQFYTQLEAQDIKRLAWGTSAAKKATLSFWVKSSVAGTYGIKFNHNKSSGTSYYLSSYTINSANTWEYKTIVIPPQTEGGQTASANSAGLLMEFVLGLSSGFDGAGTQNKWQTTNSTGVPSGTVYLPATSGATWQVTGIQLVEGNYPDGIPFMYRSYGEELALCQRYFSIPINSVDEDGNSNNHAAIGVGRGGGGGAVVVWALHAPMPMRDRPSITTSGSYYITDGTSRTQATPTSVSISNFSPNSSTLLANYNFSSAVCDDDRVNMVGSHQNVKITLDAEL